MLARRFGPEFTIFGRVLTVRLPWAIAAAIALGLTAFELAPRDAVDVGAIVWYLNGMLVAGAAIGSIIFHEAAHAAVGQRLGRAPGRISIYPLGGVTDDFNDPGTPFQESVVAIAGPLASAGICGIFFLAWFLFPSHTSIIGRDLLYIGIINGTLAAVNLLPGYPLDGGRVFRALVWYLHDDFSTGTKASVTYGQVISTFALATGLVFLGSRGSWSLLGIWIILGAWGVARVGRQEMTRSVLLSLGGSLTAGEAVRGINPHVRAQQPLDEVLEALLAEVHSGPGLVTENGEVIGVISLNELRRYRRINWPETTALSAMVPIDQLSVLDEGVSVRKLLNELIDRRSDTLLVTGHDGVVGALNRQLAIEKLIDRLQSAKFDT